MLKNLKISNRLVLSSLFMGVVSASIILMLISGIKSNSKDFTSFLEGPYELQNALLDSKINGLSLVTVTKELLMTKDEFAINDINNLLLVSINDLEKSLETLDKHKNVNLELMNNYIKYNREYITAVNQIISLSKNDDKAPMSKLIIQDSNLILNNINNEYITLSEIINDNVLSTESHFIYNTEKIALISFILFILAAIVIIIVLRKTRHSIIKPLIELERITEEINNGNISVVIDYNSQDEIGIVCSKLETSMKNIKNYILDIERIMGEFANCNFDVEPVEEFKGDFHNIKESINNMIEIQSESFRSIQIASDEVYTGAEQVSQASQSLAQGATQQASSIEELSASISEISYQVKQNSDNAKKSNDMSYAIGIKIEKSNEQMQQMINAMQSINIKSSEIGKIIKTIDDIAFQTNILALNAAVEAARAGTAGKGFAVVADEVRNLASKSAEAAKNTTILIEDSIKAVQDGSDIANKTASSLIDVVNSASEITLLIQEISSASTEQATFIEQVNIGVEQISAVVQTNSATSQESAAASEELSGQSNILKSLVKKFTIKKDNNIDKLSLKKSQRYDMLTDSFGNSSKY